MRCTRRQDSVTSYYEGVSPHEYPDYDDPVEDPPKMACWKKSLIITSIVLVSLALLIFILIFVVLPIVFMLHIPLERFFMFMNIDEPKNPDFKHPEKYGIKGAVNFYITTEDFDTKGHEGKLASIGAWLVHHHLNEYSKETDVSKILRESKVPVVLYFHGVACNRALPIVGYQALRKHFLVIGVDYRGFGDSTNLPLTEAGVIHDNVQVYEWIHNRTTQDVYVWGHSLGSALSAHTVKILKEERNIVPKGLVLESAFTTMREEIINHPLGKVFKWLAYFNSTFLDPLEEHRFKFWTTTNVKSVDCPIMIMHAEDDNIIPYKLGQRLAQVAKTERNLAIQGDVFYHQFRPLGYKHVGIITDPNIPTFIKEFIEKCNEFWKIRGRKSLSEF